MIPAAILFVVLLLSIPVCSLYLMARNGRGTGLRGSRGQYAGFRLPRYFKGGGLGVTDVVWLRDDIVKDDCGKDGTDGR